MEIPTIFTQNNTPFTRKNARQAGAKIRITILALLLAGGGLAQTQVEVFVNSRGTNAIKKYDGDGNYLGNFIAPGAGGLASPEDIVFHPDGSILVTGAGNGAIKRYDGQTGAFLGNFSSGYTLEIPSKMSIGWDSLIYVTQWGTAQNKVVRFDLDGHFVDEFTQTPTPNGLGHLWDADKNFYISVYGNGGNGTVQKFNSLGASLGTFINTSILQGPTDIWFDGNGDMLVEDWTAGKVLRYNAGGQYVGEFITGLTNPEGIAFLPNGNLLIGDWGEDAVHLIDSTGNVLGYFTSGNGLADPNNVIVRLTTTTSAGERSQTPSLSVHPNPASDFVFLETAAVYFSVDLFDTAGRTVLSANNSAMLDVGSLPSGVYWVKMTEAASGKTRMGRVSIVR